MFGLGVTSDKTEVVRFHGFGLCSPLIRSLIIMLRVIRLAYDLLLLACVGLTYDKSIMVMVMVLFEDDSPLISPSW
jgi:hypothetical protein